MSVHKELKKEAIEAVENLITDMSVEPQEALDSLEEVGSIIDSAIAGLKDDLKRKKG